MTFGPAPLFCPADRPDRIMKAAERADVVIIDLEDGVRPDDRAAARDNLRALDLDPARVIVRVSPAGTADFLLDLRSVVTTRFRTIMLAKTSAAADIDATPADMRVVALCETAAGVIHAAEIARHPRVVALMWGAEDLIGSLGGTSSRHPDGTYRDIARHARSAVLLAAGAAGKPAIDAVHLDIADAEGLRAECEDAVASGFVATACIHPAQVAIVRAAYQPTEQQVTDARALLAAAAGQAGVFQHRGQMVDEPLLRQARAVLARVS